MARESWQPRLGTGLTLQVVEGETIVLDRANERVHQLNEVGTFILEHCDGTRTPEEIAAAVAERYDVAPTRAEIDARQLLDRMRTLEILE